MKGRFPFAALPSGWFAVAESAEIRTGDVRSLHYFGEDLVLFRSVSGALSLLGAYCPHLGAHLGGGTVSGERLRCPFHGFEFDGAGRCQRTGYGTKPPVRAAARSWPLCERGGVLFTWYDALGRAPAWPLPPLVEEGWTAFRVERLEIDSHPQETSENSVDLGHFTVVHHFGRTGMTKDVEIDGPTLRTGYAIERVFSFAGRSASVEARFDVAVHGLGYSLVEGEVPALAARMRSLILATPVDEEKIHLRIALSVACYRSRLLTRLVERAMFWGLRTEVAADVPIWTRKRYVERPLLARGDGPIAAYRRWCQQFYPAAASARDENVHSFEPRVATR